METIFNNLTIVIPTANRQSFVLRLLRSLVLQKCPFQILILDGSFEENYSEFSEEWGGLNVCYKKYDPELSLYHRLKDGYEHIKTPYAVMCGDDDLIITSSLACVTKHLENNPEYVFSQGLIWSCILDESGKPAVSYYSESSCLNYSPVLDRVSAYIGYDYRPLMYAVHSVEVYKIMLKEITSDWSHDHQFCEILFNAIVLCYGKAEIIRVPYMIRQGHSNSTTNTLLSWSEKIDEKNFCSDQEALLNTLAKHVTKNHGYWHGKVMHHLRFGWHSYLSRYAPNRISTVILMSKRNMQLGEKIFGILYSIMTILIGPKRQFIKPDNHLDSLFPTDHPIEIELNLISKFPNGILK
jgi:glycosyltransferase domain-containing protein